MTVCVDEGLDLWDDSNGQDVEKERQELEREAREYAESLTTTENIAFEGHDITPENLESNVDGADQEKRQGGEETGELHDQKTVVLLLNFFQRCHNPLVSSALYLPSTRCIVLLFLLHSIYHFHALHDPIFPTSGYLPSMLFSTGQLFLLFCLFSVLIARKF